MLIEVLLRYCSYNITYKSVRHKNPSIESYAVFFKPKLYLTDSISLYGLVGYGHTKTSLDYITRQNGGLAQGIGIGYDITTSTEITFDYTVYPTVDTTYRRDDEQQNNNLQLSVLHTF